MGRGKCEVVGDGGKWDVGFIFIHLREYSSPGEINKVMGRMLRVHNAHIPKSPAHSS